MGDESLNARTCVIQAEASSQKDTGVRTESMFKVRREDLHHFTREENEALTRVGPATLMGNLMRQYWIPVVPSAHLRDPGGPPLPLRLLGEDLVLFRKTDGAVGLIGAYCPHRLAPLYFG